jgi:hypothetical protein
MYRAEGEPILAWQFWAITLALHLPSSVIIGWLYNRSKGNILVAGIGHAAGPTTIDLLRPGLTWSICTAMIAVGALTIVLVDRMWERLPHEHPAVYDASVTAPLNATGQPATGESIVTGGLQL